MDNSHPQSPATKEDITLLADMMGRHFDDTQNAIAGIREDMGKDIAASEKRLMKYVEKEIFSSEDRMKLHMNKEIFSSEDRMKLYID